MQSRSLLLAYAAGLLVPIACFSPNPALDADSDSDSPSIATTGGVAGDSGGGSGSNEPGDGSTSSSQTGATSPSTTSEPEDDTTGSELTTLGSDDGTTSGDGTTSSVADVCGDAIVGDSEACDDGVNDGAYGGCAPDCQELAPFCGDGIVDEGAGEFCDDANSLDADGCSVECISSGSELWSNVYDGPESGDDSFTGIEVLDESIYVVGTTHYLGCADQSGLIRRLALDGGTLWTSPFFGDDESCYDLDVSGFRVVAEDDVVVATDSTQGTVFQDRPNPMRLRRTDATLAKAWSDLRDAYAETRGMDYLSSTGTSVFVGLATDQVGVQHGEISLYNSDGELEAQLEEGHELFDVRWAGAGNIVVLGDWGDVRVASMTTTGDDVWARTFDDASGGSIEISEEGDVAVCLTVDLGLLVSVHDGSDGALMWSTSLIPPEGRGYRCHDVLLDGDSVVLAGEVYDSINGLPAGSNHGSLVVRADASGEVWNVEFPGFLGPDDFGNDGSAAFAVTMAPSGDLLVAGREQLEQGGSLDGFVRLIVP